MRDLPVDEHVKMVFVRFHGGKTDGEFSDNGEEDFPDRVDEDCKDIPGADTFIFAGKEYAYDRNDESQHIGTAVSQKYLAFWKVQDEECKGGPCCEQNNMQDLYVVLPEGSDTKREEYQKDDACSKAVETVNDIDSIHHAYNGKGTKEDPYPIGHVHAQPQISYHRISKPNGGECCNDLQCKTKTGTQRVVEIFKNT